MRYDLIVFDLDGTLVDTSADIAASLERVLIRMRGTSPPRAEIVAAIGNGVRMLVERTAAPPVEPVVQAFIEEYGVHLLDETRLYPGVAETLPLLPVRKVVLSNKPESMTRRILEGLGIAREFAAVYGGDSFPVRKPDPETFRRAAAGARRALMVGDSGVDVQTARNAGVPVCVVTYGYCHPGELDGADFRIDRFEQLPGLMAGSS